jgi:hypothetical protein
MAPSGPAPDKWPPLRSSAGDLTIDGDRGVGGCAKSIRFSRRRLDQAAPARGDQDHGPDPEDEQDDYEDQEAPVGALLLMGVVHAGDHIGRN